MTIINKSVHCEISCVYYSGITGFRVNNRYIIAVFIKTKVIFAFVLLKGNLQKEFMRI